jgi:pimeloyl-ACP methyl ester carboxylesterase
VEGFLERPLGRTGTASTARGTDAARLPARRAGSTHNYFRPLERLADERRVVVYDQLGCGARTAGGEWSLAIFTESSTRLRASRARQVHLLGTSWAGCSRSSIALARAGVGQRLVPQLDARERGRVVGE